LSGQWVKEVLKESRINGVMNAPAHGRAGRRTPQDANKATPAAPPRSRCWRIAACLSQCWKRRPTRSAGADDEALHRRLSILEWAIAESPGKNHQDMAVKVRRWRLSIDAGEATWDARLAETLLEALGR